MGDNVLPMDRPVRIIHSASRRTVYVPIKVAAYLFQSHHRLRRMMEYVRMDADALSLRTLVRISHPVSRRNRQMEHVLTKLAALLFHLMDYVPIRRRVLLMDRQNVQMGQNVYHKPTQNLAMEYVVIRRHVCSMDQLHVRMDQPVPS